ncbi:hypothetical protein [Microlunatus speluncae]|uniref:hypothetical protein n=1 Tax=Microlunatus speluncae TaxID=2594267 RepID=UPI0013762B24|nr:hypothetical protein [Microlunatus speluncae]
MRLPWHRHRSQPESRSARYPTVVHCDLAKDDAEIPWLVSFVLERFEEDQAVVDRYRRTRGRGPLPQPQQNVLNSPEHGPPSADGLERVQVLLDHQARRRARFEEIEAAMVAEGRITDQMFADLMVYAGHFRTHPDFLRAWSVINYLNPPDAGRA